MIQPLIAVSNVQVCGPKVVLKFSHTYNTTEREVSGKRAYLVRMHLMIEILDSAI